MKFKQVTRRYFYRRFRNIKWGDVEDIKHKYGFSLCYIPDRKLHYKLEHIPGVINENKMNKDFSLDGPEDTLFYIEII